MPWCLSILWFLFDPYFFMEKNKLAIESSLEIICFFFLPFYGPELFVLVDLPVSFVYPYMWNSSSWLVTDLTI